MQSHKLINESLEVVLGGHEISQDLPKLHHHTSIPVPLGLADAQAVALPLGNVLMQGLIIELEVEGTNVIKDTGRGGPGPAAELPGGTMSDDAHHWVCVYVYVYVYVCVYEYVCMYVCMCTCV
jgi:hypothetical protein